MLFFVARCLSERAGAKKFIIQWGKMFLKSLFIIAAVFYHSNSSGFSGCVVSLK